MTKKQKQALLERKILRQKIINQIKRKGAVDDVILEELESLEKIINK